MHREPRCLYLTAALLAGGPGDHSIARRIRDRELFA